MATTIWQFGLAYGVLGGLGLAATRQVVAATLVGNWFVQRRGLVQGMVGSAGALGEMLVVPPICSSAYWPRRRVEGFSPSSTATGQ
jgi:hypothetical protein